VLISSLLNDALTAFFFFFGLTTFYLAQTLPMGLVLYTVPVPERDRDHFHFGRGLLCCATFLIWVLGALTFTGNRQNLNYQLTADKKALN